MISLKLFDKEKIIPELSKGYICRKEHKMFRHNQNAKITIILPGVSRKLDSRTLASKETVEK